MNSQIHLPPPNHPKSIVGVMPVHGLHQLGHHSTRPQSRLMKINVAGNESVGQAIEMDNFLARQDCFAMDDLFQPGA
jgi:hypothetical protein